MTTFITLILPVAVLVAVGIVVTRRRSVQLDQRRDAASAHRDKAADRSRSAERADLAAKEQSAKAQRERLAAEDQAAHAERERVAAGRHEELAREIDPDVANQPLS